MYGELVHVTTSDGVRLDGVLHVPDREAPSPLPVDAVVCLHGTGSNFYGSTVIQACASKLLQIGLAALRVNLRSHDGISTANTSTGRKRQGAAYEMVDECRHDIEAWLELLVARGHQRLGILGHSMGAIKSVYAQALAPHPHVAAVMAVSPPRLSHQAFTHSDQSTEFRALLHEANHHLDAGHPDALMEVRFPLPMLISAASYVDKYGPAERFNVINFIGRLTCPTLFTFGGEELDHGGVAFAGMPAEIAKVKSPGQKVDTLLVEGADHLYSQSLEPLATSIQTWLSGLRRVE